MVLNVDEGDVSQTAAVGWITFKVLQGISQPLIFKIYLSFFSGPFSIDISLIRFLGCL